METLQKKTDILQAGAKAIGKIQKISIDGVGFFFLKTMNGHQRDRFDGAAMRLQSGKDEPIRALVAVSVLCNEGGTLAFEQKDIKLVGESMAGWVLDQIFAHACTINKLKKDDIDELAGNSSTTEN